MRQRRAARPVDPGRAALAVPALLALATATPAQLRAGRPDGQPGTRAAVPPGRQPAAQPRGPVPFQPGVSIDWASRTVRIDGTIVLRSGSLEFLACFPGKEHESIVRLDARAEHVYMALGLTGFEPGHPPRWNDAEQRYEPASGDLVEVAIEWTDGGRMRQVAGHEWLVDLEYGRPPVARPWVFAGSTREPDGSLTADHTGAGIALVDMPDALLALTRSRSASTAELWAGANTSRIPPSGTRVRVLLRPPQSGDLDARVDFRGAIHVDDRLADVADLADLLAIRHRLGQPPLVVPSAALESDRVRLLRELRALGVSHEWLRLETGTASRGPGLP